MSLLTSILASGLHPAPSTLAAGFALLLGLWLLVAEEAEFRRGRANKADPGHPAAAASAPRMSSSTA